MDSDSAHGADKTIKKRYPGCAVMRARIRPIANDRGHSALTAKRNAWSSPRTTAHFRHREPRRTFVTANRDCGEAAQAPSRH
jgi:hypothetical protein